VEIGRPGVGGVMENTRRVPGGKEMRYEPNKKGGTGPD